MKSFIIIGFIIAAILLTTCKSEEILLHGDILGFVTDASTNLPVQDASVKLNPDNDSTLTIADGSYNFRNLTPGQYEIEASKNSYADSKENIVVAEGETQRIDFSLDGIPVPTPSVNFLDFGLDSTTLRFTITNTGKGKFAFFLTPNQDWITVSPSNGFISNDSVNFIVTVNKTGLTESIYKESIKVISFAGQVQLPDLTISVYLNGVSDRDGNYYKLVRIGSQVWMAENLNVGVIISTNTDAKDNAIIEKYCYDEINCNIYGGLYKWNEAMQYNSPDAGIIGTTQGVCPSGWHIPTENEWFSLFDYLGGRTVAGGKLKEAGITHWSTPNTGATNESGFSALPGGWLLPENNASVNLGFEGAWWTAESKFITLVYYTESVSGVGQGLNSSFSVRCVKNP